MTSLPRLKPDPIPAIHPVPEYAAPDPLKDVYERTKAGLDVPWMGVVAMAFAQYPRFYGTLWSSLEPIVAGSAFRDACQRLRDCAEEQATLLQPPPILPRLSDLGYDPREVDQIRACNEVFSAGNMPYILMASLARLLLEGQGWEGCVDGDAGKGQAGQPVTRGQPVSKPLLIEPHHADPTMVALYADIRQTLGLPFVNTDYRAFARWPSYFSLGWEDLKQAVVSDRYAQSAGLVHERAITLAAGLPNETGLTADTLKQAAAQDAPLDEVLSVVRLFQWLLPGLALNVAFLRAQLE